jgi:crotonobetainyl-CoA:carnitine CoA-transferase CaiB-like acyl-CoA transferase
MDKPLAGLKVLELARILAGPWAGQLLADLGAEVVKVERAGAGDDTRIGARRSPPDGPARHTSMPATAARLHLPSTSRREGSRKKCADSAAERRWLSRISSRRLGALSGLIMRPFATGHRPCLLLHHRLRPDGALCAARRLRLHHQGMGGCMSLTGEPDGRPRRGYSLYATSSPASNSTVAITGALRERGTDGRRRSHRHGAARPVQVGVLANQALNWMVRARCRAAWATATPIWSLTRPSPRADGQVIVAVGNDRQFEATLHPAGLENCLQTSASAPMRPGDPPRRSDPPPRG